jgi:dTDP-4-amino-4,6-dideoxygalactose transaminase
LALLNLEPVPVDISPDTLAIDMEKADAATATCEAVLGAHLFGVPAPLHKITGAPLVEDCAQTLGVEVDGRTVGSLGEAAICSFYATKLLAAGHGGLLAFDDDARFAEAVSLVTHDKRDEWEPRMHVAMSDFNAALALAQLRKLPAMIAERRRIAARFAEAVGDPADFARSACSRFILFTDGASEEMIEKFNSVGIEAKKPVYKPLYAYLGLGDELFPVAAETHKRIVSIPIYPGLSEPEIEFIEETLAGNAGNLSRSLRRG